MTSYNTLRLPSLSMTTPDFPGDAPCATSDAEAWFPLTSTMTRDNKTAAVICTTCPFQQPCLQFGIDTRATGIWGGIRLASGRNRSRRGVSA